MRRGKLARTNYTTPGLFLPEFIMLLRKDFLRYLLGLPAFDFRLWCAFRVPDGNRQRKGVTGAMGVHVMIASCSMEIS